ncbi:MAG: aromatic acid exporter family protein [Acidaminobacteraceae bacterium]
MKIISILKLKKEAQLLDSKLYVLKTFLAISTAYILGINIPIVNRDMISVLFGLILTLQPVNIAGIKNGVNQIKATAIGALVTAIIIYFFGINFITVGLSVAITLYICLVINWKSISTVALFTAIYMTQNFQLGVDGYPSIIRTVEVRLLSLTFGIFMAILFNYIFSTFQYRFMTNKRVVYIMKRLLSDMEELKTDIHNKDRSEIQNNRLALIKTSGKIEWVYSLFDDMSKEFERRGKSSNINLEELKMKMFMLNHLRIICHLLFDINYVLGDRIDDYEDLNEIYEYISDAVNMAMDNLGVLKNLYDGKHNSPELKHNWIVLPKRRFDNGYAYRIYQNLIDINKNIEVIVKKLRDELI